MPSQPCRDEQAAQQRRKRRGETERYKGIGLRDRLGQTSYPYQDTHVPHGGKDLSCFGQEHPDPDLPRENLSCGEGRGPLATKEPLTALVLHRSRLQTLAAAAMGHVPRGMQ